MTPPPEVLDLFAVPDDPEPVPGGRRQRFRAGDLVLSPGRDPQVASWLDPVLARLSVGLDEAPLRRRRDLRLALPVPARDGSWVVEGWGASRHEPGVRACEDLEVTLAAGRLLHARLAAAVRSRPPGLPERTDRWPRVAHLLDDRDLGPSQLVHAGLAGSVLLDQQGAPLVVDVTPAWRPLVWAEALTVLDAVLLHGADPALLRDWSAGARRQAVLRALGWRAADDERPGRPGYEEVLSLVAST